MQIGTDEQSWLLDQMAGLVRTQGPGPLLSFPIAQPTTTFFPDPWEPSGLGLWRVSRRLLIHAGLEEYDVSLEVDQGFEIEDPAGAEGEESVSRAQAWFMGIQDGTCHFGFDPSGIEDPETVTGALAHEVTHAYRTHHEITCEDHDVEERLTDLTSVFLGFGILTANASYSYRSHLGQGYSYYRHQTLGYLPPECMTFLLAVQVSLRDVDGSLRKSTAKHLEANQSASFLEALEELDPEYLTERLHLPDQADWPTEKEVRRDSLPDPPPDMIWEVLPESHDYNAGTNIFRVHGTHTALFTGLAILILGFPAVAVLFAKGLRPLLFGLVPMVLLVPGVLGFIVGRRRRFFTCSDPDCKTRLMEVDRLCPGCGGTVKGTIAHADERLADE